MRRDLVFNQGTADEARFRVTSTAARGEVIVDGPVFDDGYTGRVRRMRFTVDEAQAFVGLLLEAVAVAGRRS